MSASYAIYKSTNSRIFRQNNFFVMFAYQESPTTLTLLALPLCCLIEVEFAGLNT